MQYLFFSLSTVRCYFHSSRCWCSVLQVSGMGLCWRYSPTGQMMGSIVIDGPGWSGLWLKKKIRRLWHDNSWKQVSAIDPVLPPPPPILAVQNGLTLDGTRRPCLHPTARPFFTDTRQFLTGTFASPWSWTVPRHWWPRRIPCERTACVRKRRKKN